MASALASLNDEPVICNNPFLSKQTESKVTRASPTSFKGRTNVRPQEFCGREDESEQMW